MNKTEKIAGKYGSGIINLLFDGITHNTSGHFTRCSQLVKYPRVLSVKLSIKMYLCHAIENTANQNGG